MKRIVKNSILILLIFICSCSMATFDNVNNYKGSVILSIEHDSVGTIDTYELYLKDMNGDYNRIRLTPEYTKLFSVGDTI